MTSKEVKPTEAQTSHGFGYPDDRVDRVAPDDLGSKSYGVARVEALTAVITLKDRVAIFCSIFLVSYVFTLDGILRYAYQPYATASYSNHSLLATINVLRAVIAAAAQPTAAKLANVFGRLELIIVSVVFYVVGSVVEACSTGVSGFAAGAVLYQIGYTLIQLLIQVIIGDLTSTRGRLFFSFLPVSPNLINTWVSGNISGAVIGHTTWRWGIGMFCIIFPVSVIPLIVSLAVVGNRARRAGLLDKYRTPFQVLGFRAAMVDLLWRLDIIGVLLVIALFALILVPLTVAGGFQTQWRQAKIIAPIVLGIVSIPVFLWWQSRAPYPLVPFRKMKDRGIWAAMGIILFTNFAWYMQGDYLFTVLQVSFAMDVEMATRVTSIWTFVSTLVGFSLGLVVFKVRQLKPFIITGTCLFMVAFGLLIQFRGNTSSRVGVIAAQVLLGMGGGLFTYPAQTSIQVSVKHEHLATMIGMFLSTYNIGNALGNTVSGAVWTQTLPAALQSWLQPLGNETLAQLTYADPFTIIAEYPVGTPERSAIISAYSQVQRLLCITGLCLSVPLVAFALFTRNPKLNNEQTLASDSDGDEESRRTT
ncbi:ferrioxamine B transporter [Conoideocrella luteorostrata]|uniref:Ferrioxamine B transporter n=1 Tax=Conoideocrella luteorostrata TaxID=1105319 RepID=A0AAJ0CPC2_9HYPO|nr:ferrioxamine B transporter [Conoideocrella luteorostrata]